MRVGEASHPGPVQTRSVKRLESTQLDSDDSDPERSSVHTVGRRRTQVDPDNIAVVRTGRFSVLSSHRDIDCPSVQVCRAPTNVVDCGRVVSVRSEEIAVVLEPRVTGQHHASFGVRFDTS